jgi:N-dimethylarginine dimethylaminohydrolase
MHAEAVSGMALNFVTLGPRHILMACGNPNTQSFYGNMGLRYVTVRVDELHKAAGGIGCLTGILKRASV